MRPSFAFGPSPMIVGVIKQRTVKDAIAEIKNGEINGARGFDLHLATLDEEFRNVESIKQIIECTDKPILALTYNNGFFGDLGMNEEERTALLMMAVDAGASAVDMQGYTFDKESSSKFKDIDFVTEELSFLKEKMPREVTLDPETVRKQKAFIDEVHSKGAEVLMSMHFGVHMSAYQLEALARLGKSKGADIVKMVTPCATEEELAECISSTIYLKKNLGFPFSYHANGKMGRLSRKICPMLGSHIMFCNVNYGPVSDVEQLHLGSMTEAYRRLGVI